MIKNFLKLYGLGLIPIIAIAGVVTSIAFFPIIFYWGLIIFLGVCIPLIIGEQIVTSFHIKLTKPKVPNYTITTAKNTHYYNPAAVVVEATKAYCVKCKENNPIKDKVVKVSDSGRRMAQGVCPNCGTRVNRILGKAQ